MYWDFENLHAGVLEAKYGEGAYAKQDNRFKPQEPPGRRAGPRRTRRVLRPCRHQPCIRQLAVLRPLPRRPAAECRRADPALSAWRISENGADIKLCLDATKDISRFAHVGVVNIIGGDSDYMPIAQKIKAAGRTLIGIGGR